VEIPIANVYYLLCYAWDKLEEKDIVKVQPTAETRLVDLFARVLNSGIDHLLKKGFDRGYVTDREDTRLIRGRIQFQSTIKRNLLRTGQLHCEYDDLSYDVLHNRILKSTLQRLLKIKELDPKVRRNTEDHLRRLVQVHNLQLTERAFGQVQLHRNNFFYDFLIRICKLLFDNLLPTEQSGDWKFRSFLQDQAQMAYLFENFVRNFYRHEAARKFGAANVKICRNLVEWKFSSINQEAEQALPKMQTDVTIIRKEKTIIVECKYMDDPFAPERFDGVKKLRGAHLYQVDAYLDNLKDDNVGERRQAILLYPMAMRPLQLDYRRPTGELVSVRTIDLSKNWQSIHSEMLQLLV
jgi:5-methylcytosine-specific restriction enzyme subunit McrC